MSTSRLRAAGMQPYADIVDFIERTTYAIWNEREPALIPEWYGPHSTIWGDSGAMFGGETVTARSTEEQQAFPDMRGVIPDTIWTGDDTSGYRTSMRWSARGTHAGAGSLGPPTGRVVHDSAIANCVVLSGQYLEEWTVANGLHLAGQVGLDAGTAVRLLHAPVPVPESYRSARTQGATVPAIPARVDGAGLFVTELLDDLYNHRDLDVIGKRYAPGVPYLFGAARWSTGHDGVRREAARWLDLLPDLRLTIEELYWNDDGQQRSRVAVRYRITGTARRDGAGRPVSIMGIHHLHVRGALVTGEWAEYDELALHAQLNSP